MTLGPGTSTVDEGGLMVLDGTLRQAAPGGAQGTYRLDIFGELIGTGNTLAANPNTGTNEPPILSRLNIGSGGVFSPGATNGDIVVFVSEARFDFVPGSRVIMDVDMDSADGSNPYAGDNDYMLGGNIWKDAKNSDVLNLSRWNTTRGTLELNNVGSTPWTNGVVLKLFKKPGDEFWNYLPPNEYVNVTDNPTIPVMDPPTPGLGLLWDVSNFKNVGVITVGEAPYATNAVPLVTSWTSTNVTLSWPTNHTGWELQTQSNPLDVGLSTNWTLVSGSKETNLMSFTISTDEETRLYRLAYPASDVINTNTP
jgi:hypothetical protein